MQYSLERNFAPNLFSLYSQGEGAIFQIDANFGFPAALLVSSPCIHLASIPSYLYSHPVVNCRMA